MNKCLLLLIMLPFWSFAQIKQTTWSELASMQKAQQRLVVVYLHSDHCKYCFMMEKKTFAERNVQTQLNEQFYFVSISADDKTDISFNNHMYKGSKTKPSKSDHELAEYLSNGKGYPAIVFLDYNLKPIYLYNGFMKTDVFLQNLTLLQQYKNQY